MSVPSAVGDLLPILFALGVSAPVPATLFGSVLLFSRRGRGVREASHLPLTGSVFGVVLRAAPLTFSTALHGPRKRKCHLNTKEGLFPVNVQREIIKCL